MNHRTRGLCAITCLTLITLTTCAANGADDADNDFVPLFNGRDLTGWVPINVAPGTFRVEDGIIVSTGFPTGLMRTERQYENFIVELQWRHMKPGGNAGLFVWGDQLTACGSPFARGMEVQILDNGFNVKGKNEWYTTHGDIFPVLGSKRTPTGRISSTGQRSFPIEERCKSSPEWNHYRLEARDGVLRLSVNGKEVTVGKNCAPRKGYLCLESEGSECHFRNIRIRELPSTNPSPEEIADPAVGFVPLYTGVDLSGWKADPGHDGHWQPNDWRLSYDGNSEAADKNLWTEKEYGDFVLVCDWRWTTSNAQSKPLPVILANGEPALDDTGKPKTETLPDAGDSGIYLRGSSKSQVNIWCWPIGSGEVYGYRTDRSMPAEVRAGVTPTTKADAPIGKWNRFIITMKGDRLTVDLNGKTVLPGAHLPGVPERGPIALQHHGDPIEFANIFIREL
jgi:3-keto-disaccharide hydrolase